MVSMSTRNIHVSTGDNTVVRCGTLINLWLREIPVHVPGKPPGWFGQADASLQHPFTFTRVAARNNLAEDLEVAAVGDTDDARRTAVSGDHPEEGVCVELHLHVVWDCQIGELDGAFVENQHLLILAAPADVASRAACEVNALERREVQTVVQVSGCCELCNCHRPCGYGQTRQPPGSVVIRRKITPVVTTGIQEFAVCHGTGTRQTSS